MLSLELYLFSNEVVILIIVLFRKQSDERILSRLIDLISEAIILKQVKKRIVWAIFMPTSKILILILILGELQIQQKYLL